MKRTSSVHTTATYIYDRCILNSYSCSPSSIHFLLLLLLPLPKTGCSPSPPFPASLSQCSRVDVSSRMRSWCNCNCCCCCYYYVFFPPLLKKILLFPLARFFSLLHLHTLSSLQHQIPNCLGPPPTSTWLLFHRQLKLE